MTTTKAPQARPPLPTPDNCPDWCDERLIKEHAQYVMDGTIKDSPMSRHVLNSGVALECRMHSATFGEGVLAAKVDYDISTGEGTIFGPETIGSMTAPEALMAAENMLAAVTKLVEIQAAS